ncbi:MAG: uncharacterized protein QG586_1031, partial [Pseudomonadota bacterium]|nr:uncharacterized protein [Pseudomonadota bacterium]
MKQARPGRGTTATRAGASPEPAATMDFAAADWVNIGLTEAILSRHGSPLYVAADIGAIAAVKVMAEAGSNLEVSGPNGRRPLHAAVAGGHVGIAGILLSAGCEVDPQDEDGNTPLVTAILQGQTGSVQ